MLREVSIGKGEVFMVGHEYRLVEGDWNSHSAEEGVLCTIQWHFIALGDGHLMVIIEGVSGYGRRDRDVLFT